MLNQFDRKWKALCAFLKEFDGEFRAYASFVAAILLMGFSPNSTPVMVAFLFIGIFSTSLILELFGIGYVLKRHVVQESRKKIFLNFWLIVCIFGLFLSTKMIPEIQNISLYGSREAFYRISAFWGNMFGFLGAALIARICYGRIENRKPKRVTAVLKKPL